MIIVTVKGPAVRTCARIIALAIERLQAQGVRAVRDDSCNIVANQVNCTDVLFRADVGPDFLIERKGEGRVALVEGIIQQIVCEDIRLKTEAA